MTSATADTRRRRRKRTDARSWVLAPSLEGRRPSPQETVRSRRGARPPATAFVAWRRPSRRCPRRRAPALGTAPRRLERLGLQRSRVTHVVLVHDVASTRGAEPRGGPPDRPTFSEPRWRSQAGGRDAPLRHPDRVLRPGRRRRRRRRRATGRLFERLLPRPSATDPARGRPSSPAPTAITSPGRRVDGYCGTAHGTQGCDSDGRPSPPHARATALNCWPASLRFLTCFT